MRIWEIEESRECVTQQLTVEAGSLKEPADFATRKAKELTAQSKIARKQAAVAKAQQQLAKKRRDLAQAQRSNLTG